MTAQPAHQPWHMAYGHSQAQLFKLQPQKPAQKHTIINSDSESLSP